MARHLVRIGFQKVLSLSCILLMAGMGSAALAQAPAPPPAAQSQNLPPDQLENLVAPIALYPDPLLGQVLAASTYPVELVEAQQWLQANSNLHGQQLVDAAKQQNWDASVQAMVAMPDVLSKLTQDIHWTTDLGNAFLAQPSDVMAAVQRLRSRAEANGKLQSNQQENVTTENQDGQQAIEIQPANPDMLYVPNYDPAYVWGPPVWGEYPPLYYPYYGFGWYPGINIGLCFGGWGGWGWGGWGWGWGPNWFGGGLFINAGFFHHYGYGFGGVYAGRFGAGFRGTAAWAHDPAHRMGAGYSTAGLNARYGSASRAARVEAGRSGAYHSFGTASNGFRGGAASNGFRASNSVAAGARSYSGAGRSYGAGAGGYQHFQSGRQAYQPQARSYSNAGGQRYGGFSGGRSYSAPSRSYSAPRYSAPSGGRSFGGGGGHSFSGGGGHSFGGGGGHSGGGGHGGGRR
ncbi:MAG TPA: DUF3300 domain-containing protein [Bryobacteraceae bacterium]|nr:DUF3300 domain-containing protein [Bryobacteraceae bacterium]